MKRNLRLFLLMLLVGTSGLMYSCKDDKMESITLKRSGGLKVIIKNGESPVTSTQITFSNADTGNELDVVTTDEQGVIDFGKLNEGNYAISFETSEPYSRINQELQVVSGENKEYTVQVQDYVGDLTVFLKDYSTNDLIMEDLKVGVAIVPKNNDFKKAFTNEDKIALATGMKYFGAEGSVSFENIPTGDYILYHVVGDSIIAEVEQEEQEEEQVEEEVSVNRSNEKIVHMYVHAAFERLFNKEVWTATTAINFNTDEAISSFPLESIVFSRDSDGDFKYTMNIANGIIEEGYLDYDTYYGDYEFDLDGGDSNNEDISVSWSSNDFYLDENGQISMRFYYFQIWDGVAGEYIYDGNNIDVTFE